MPSAAEAYKTAQEAALRASAEMQAAMALSENRVRIYTEVPVNALLPYVVVGEDQVLTELGGEGCPDEAEIYATVHVWSRVDPLDKGRQARAIGAAIRAALATALALEGWTIDVWNVEGERYSTDPDQSTHGVLNLHYLLTAQA